MIELQKRVILGLRSGPHLLVTGGVHGDEYEPMAAIRLLGQRLATESMMGRVTLVPVVNEAAFLRGDRTADDGLDLARTCPGRPDGSITEQIAHSLSTLIRSADFYIDLHTGGLRLRVLPMTGYMLHPDKAVLDQQRQMARAFNLPIVWGTDPHLEGRSLSVARDARIPTIYAEYLGGASINCEGVEAYVEGCLNVMTHLGMTEHVPPPSRVTDVVEDGRTGSGHMQVCNLSPADGFFESAVALGDRVQKGDLLGQVIDPCGKSPIEIRSQQTGVVLVLRAIPSVKKGDSLGVILETITSALA